MPCKNYENRKLHVWLSHWHKHSSIYRSQSFVELCAAIPSGLSKLYFLLCSNENLIYKSNSWKRIDAYMRQ